MPRSAPSCRRSRPGRAAGRGRPRGRGLASLCVVDVVGHADAAAGPCGVAVGLGAVAASTLNPRPAASAASPSHSPAGAVPASSRGAGCSGRVLAGLAHVPDVGEPERDGPPPARRPRPARPGPVPAEAVVACPGGGRGPTPDRGEDLDPFLPLVDLPAELLPGFVAGDHRGVGPLRADEDEVVERVGVQAPGGVEEPAPVLAAPQRGDTFVEAAVQRSELVRAPARRARGRREWPAAGTGRGRRSPCHHLAAAAEPSRFPAHDGPLGAHRPGC